MLTGARFRERRGVFFKGKGGEESELATETRPEGKGRGGTSVKGIGGRWPGPEEQKKAEQAYRLKEKINTFLGMRGLTKRKRGGGNS